jgi:tetrahydromethanopterin S-methyltransferase subunit F
MLALHGMKNETKQRLKAIAIGFLIAAVIVIQGLLESNPNH